MTVTSITVADESNPAEIQAWFDANPDAIIKFITNDGRIFFIFYS